MQTKKKLDDRHPLIRTQHYPSRVKRASRKKYRHKAIIGVGGNIGDVVRRFDHLHTFLRRSHKIEWLQSAPILRNPPFGYIHQEDFHNTLIVVGTALTPRVLLKYLQQIERAFGRKRYFKDGPRTLDLDIIFYDDIQMDTKDLTIPHPGWIYRDSVLIPLKYLKGK